jgi:soluble lytic murein transglycosylase-like protein
MRKGRILFVATFLLGLASKGNAACFEEAAARYGQNAQVLWAIAKQESNLNPSALNRNANGTVDIGLMQINSIWLPKLAPYGITAEKLARDSCTNVMAGAWILAQQTQRFGNSWEAVGRYHSSLSGRKEGYATKIYGILKKYGAT